MAGMASGNWDGFTSHGTHSHVNSMSMWILLGRLGSLWMYRHARYTDALRYALSTLMHVEEIYGHRASWRTLFKQVEPQLFRAKRDTYPPTTLFVAEHHRTTAKLLNIESTTLQNHGRYICASTRRLDMSKVLTFFLESVRGHSQGLSRSGWVLLDHPEFGPMARNTGVMRKDTRTKSRQRERRHGSLKIGCFLLFSDCRPTF